ncbi:MAG: archease [Nanoarchaeota archaeon]|nr:archease [Nanoarchaeota archaeon]MBU1031201.1 archease [Nanoarchaeota archaeon]MBU1850337.1 archease [Nanoarchaeota archaeon]
MRYKLLEDIATADIAFETKGKTYEQLFENACFATADSIADTKTIKLVIKKNIVLESDDLEYLLYDLLSEIVFLKDVDGLVFFDFKIKIEKKKNKYFLKAKFLGQKIVDSIKLRADIKAVTMHLFKIKKTKNGYKVTVILDV